MKMERMSGVWRVKRVKRVGGFLNVEIRFVYKKSACCTFTSQQTNARRLKFEY